MFLSSLLIASAFAAQAVGEGPALPLKIADNQRYLVDQKGQPFFVAGDSAWSLIVQPKEEDIDRYLDDREKRGFNAIIVNLIEHKFCTKPPETRGGLAPFKKAGDFATPNPDYFDFAHKVVKKAGERGMVVWLFPAYLGYGGGDEGWFKEMKACGKETLRGYGQFVGKRFADLPNIVWVVGGDFTPKEEDQWTLGELAEGIRAKDPKHLMSAHASPQSQSAVAAFGEPKWLSVNAVYSYEKKLFQPILAEYRRTPVRPFVLLESVYEGEHDSTPEEIRRQAYWSILGGACGQFLGNNPIWHFDGPGLFPIKATWPEALGGVGSRDMAWLRKAFAPPPLRQLEPENDHAIVTKGFGKELGTALTARTADKKLAVCYVPSTGMDKRAITVDLAQFAGPVAVQWYNPTNGKTVPIGEKALPNRDSHVFMTPGDNGSKANDWLLILKVQ